MLYYLPNCCCYLVLCSSNFCIYNSVIPVRLGSLTDFANKSLIFFTEAVQRFVVFSAHCLSFDVALQLQTERFNCFDYIPQMSVWLEIFPGKNLPALWAADRSSWSFPIVSDTGSAKIVPTICDHHWILEVIQTNGTSSFMLKALCWICSCHVVVCKTEIKLVSLFCSQKWAFLFIF